MPLHITQKKSGQVEKQMGKNGDRSVEDIHVGTFSATPPVATVGFSASYTKNLGNYESVRLQVSLDMPVEVPSSLSPGQLEDRLATMFLFVQDWVDKRMKYSLDEALPSRMETG